MRLHNNHASQALADMKAKEDDFFFFADYVGIYNNQLVYYAMPEDSMPRLTGFPILIFVDADGNVSEFGGMESLDIIHGIRHRDYRRGRSIFKKAKQFASGEEVCSEEERRYWRNVVMMVEGNGYECPVDKTTVYCFLEAAERFNMRLKFIPDPSTTDRCDGWCYYVKLVEGNKTSRQVRK